MQDAAIRILRYALDAPTHAPWLYRSDPQIRLTGSGWNVPKYNGFQHDARWRVRFQPLSVNLPTSGPVLVAALLDGFILAHLLKAHRIHDPFNDYGRGLYVRKNVWIRVL